MNFSIRSPLTTITATALILTSVVIYKFKLAPKNVTSHQLIRGQIIGEVMGTGTLEARTKTNISARIPGQLVEVIADQGDRVTTGQLLARLDDAESQQQVAVALATLVATRRSAERISADLSRSEAVLALARLDHQRTTALLANKATARADVDKTAEKLRIAEADLIRSQAAIAEAQSQTVMAEKTLLFREEQLAFTEIHAPYDGLVVKRDRDSGEVLVPAASLMQIVSLEELWISAWIDETAIPTLAEGQPARIIFRSQPNEDYPGTVARLGREVDRETREFLVDVRLTQLPPNWAIGQRAEVYIEIGRQPDALLLPQKFLVWQVGQPGVFVGDNGYAKWQVVTLGLRDRQNLAISQGLEAGVTVVRPADDGKIPLEDGQRITRP